jgi:hypothetical protein
MTLYRNPLTGAMESEEEMRARPPELHGETVLPVDDRIASVFKLPFWSPEAVMERRRMRLRPILLAMAEEGQRIATGIPPTPSAAPDSLPLPPLPPGP